MFECQEIVATASIWARHGIKSGFAGTELTDTAEPPETFNLVVRQSRFVLDPPEKRFDSR